MKKLIVITDANSSIGKVIAGRLSQKGDPFLLIARRI